MSSVGDGEEVIESQLDAEVKVAFAIIRRRLGGRSEMSTYRRLGRPRLGRILGGVEYSTAHEPGVSSASTWKRMERGQGSANRVEPDCAGYHGSSWPDIEVNPH